MRTKICNLCNIAKELDQFHTRTSNGKTYPYYVCKDCRGRKESIARIENTEKYKANDDRQYKKWSDSRSVKNKEDRASGTSREKFIYWDSRKNDRLKGRENNLTLDYIRNAIENGCSYCGLLDGLITLDRIDNSIGHITTNVVPACWNCNKTRGTMPYQAWLMVATVLREARNNGLLDNWVVKRPGLRSKKI